jgi:hypothetical protein
MDHFSGPPAPVEEKAGIRPRWALGKVGSVLLPLLPFLLSGCQELILPDGPGKGPVDNFEFVWKEVDRHYSFFGLKDLDWDEIGASYRPLVTPTSTPAALFEVMAEMLGHLQDGHVRLQAPFRVAQYTGWYEPYPHNFDFPLIWNERLRDRGTTPSGMIFYGWLNSAIGYLYIPTFSGSGWAAEIDDCLEALEGVTALVVDVRDNTGGNDANAARIAGRFTSQRRLYRRIQYRNGPDHGDFSAPQDDYLESRGRSRFTGPVAVLTNRRTFSAAESFVLAMRTIPEVTVVGDVTGGGSGNPLFRELPNGWTLSISRWIEWAPDGTTHEGVGLPPDIHESTPDYLLGNVDRILAAAIYHLNGLIL